MVRMITEEKVETSLIKSVKQFLSEEDIDYTEEKDTIKIGKDREEVLIREENCTTEIRNSNVETKLNIGDISTKCERSSLNYPNISMVSLIRYKNSKDLHISTYLPLQKRDKIPISPIEKITFMPITPIPITPIPITPIPIVPITEIRPKKITKKEREEISIPRARLDIIIKDIAKKESDYTTGTTINCKCDPIYGIRCITSKLERYE